MLNNGLAQCKCVLVRNSTAKQTQRARTHCKVCLRSACCWSLSFLSACFTPARRIDNDAESATGPAARKDELAALMMCRLISQKCFMARKIRGPIKGTQASESLQAPSPCKSFYWAGHGAADKKVKKQQKGSHGQNF